MKTRKTIGVALLMTIVASFAYWLGYQHGRTPQRGRITALNSLRQIGLSFRGERNDIGRFSATGSVVTPTTPAQQR
jgi:hypothetical protein